MTSGILPYLTDNDHYSESSGSYRTSRVNNVCFILPRFSLHASNAVSFRRLMCWTALPFSLLISRTICLIEAVAISEESGIEYAPSHIAEYLLYIAAMVNYCASARGKITHRRCLSRSIVPLEPPCQGQRTGGCATGERLRLERRTWVTLVPESANLGRPGICSPEMNRGNWLGQCSC